MDALRRAGGEQGGKRGEVEAHFDPLFFKHRLDEPVKRTLRSSEPALRRGLWRRRAYPSRRTHLSRKKLVSLAIHAIDLNPPLALFACRRVAVTTAGTHRKAEAFNGRCAEGAALREPFLPVGPVVRDKLPEPIFGPGRGKEKSPPIRLRK
ncbi:hypothetical protein MRX96_046648 [Rhipicephalus microplus]